MGIIENDDTHEKRSSSKSFAMRWKHEHLRLIVFSLIISIAMTFMCMVLIYGTAMKQLYLVVDGEEQTVETRAWNVQRLLDEQAITIGPHDKVSLSLRATLKNGDRVDIVHAVPVTVMADGRSTDIMTTAQTVQEVLNEQDIALKVEDKTLQPLDAEVKPAMQIEVVRVETEFEEHEVPVPFSIVKKPDDTLASGKEKVVQSGQEGLLVEKIQLRYENGKLVSEEKVASVIEAEAIDQIVAVGTKKAEPKVTVLSDSTSEKVTKNGVTFTASKVISNATLTAYTAGKESTGKDKGHPLYGITASGAKVKEGQTIAVDPDVIPMGWWVYIEGIGFRRAEDTGGAIKGNKVDVFFESYDYAIKFGRKKGHTVYVIGPNKPTAS